MTDTCKTCGGYGQIQVQIQVYDEETDDYDIDIDVEQCPDCKEVKTLIKEKVKCGM